MSSPSPASSSATMHDSDNPVAASTDSVDVERQGIKSARKPLGIGTMHGDKVSEKGPRDLASPIEPRPATEEPPLETGSASLPQQSKQAAALDLPAMFKPTHTQLSVFSFIIFGTIWGVLARLGLEWIGTFASSSVFALVWAQMVGCFVMGFCVAKKNAIERIFPPLFVMCGTAFCGSLTTWSSMMGDVFTAFANLDQPVGTSRFTGFLAGLAITLVTFSTAQTAFQGGLHLAKIVPSPSRQPRKRSGQGTFNLITVIIGPLLWLGSLLLLIFGPSSWRIRATFAIVVGPPGSILRYLASKHLNPVCSTFPVGTITVNSISVLVFAIMALLARHPRGTLGCAALKGVQDGFCGSLSTISTMVVELRGLKTGPSYRYFLASWCISQALLVVVLGSWVWTGDRGELCWER